MDASDMEEALEIDCEVDSELIWLAWDEEEDSELEYWPESSSIDCSDNCLLVSELSLISALELSSELTSNVDPEDWELSDSDVDSELTLRARTVSDIFKYKFVDLFSSIHWTVIV